MARFTFRPKQKVFDEIDDTLMLPDNVFARRFVPNRYKSFWQKVISPLAAAPDQRRQIIIREGFSALVYSMGRFVGRAEAGAFHFPDLVKRFQSHRNIEGGQAVDEIISVRSTLLPAVFNFHNMVTRNQDSVDLEVAYSFRVDKADLAVRELLGNNYEISIDEVQDALGKDAMAPIQGLVKTKALDELEGDQSVVDELVTGFYEQLRRTLELRGLEIVEVRYLHINDAKKSGVTLMREEQQAAIQQKFEGINAEIKQRELERQEYADKVAHQMSVSIEEEKGKDHFHQIWQDDRLKESEKAELEILVAMGLDTTREERGHELETLKQRNALELDELKRERAVAGAAFERDEKARDMESLMEIQAKKREMDREARLADQEDRLAMLAKLNAMPDAPLKSMLVAFGDSLPAETMNLLAQQSRMEATKGMTPEQIIAMQAGENPAIGVELAKAYIVKAKYGEQGQKAEELYQQLIQTHKDQAGQLGGVFVEVLRNMPTAGRTTPVTDAAGNPATFSRGAEFGHLVTCNQCKAEIAATMKFCPNCGVKLRTDA